MNEVDVFLRLAYYIYALLFGFVLVILWLGRLSWRLHEAEKKVIDQHKKSVELDNGMEKTRSDIALLEKRSDNLESKFVENTTRLWQFIEKLEKKIDDLDHDITKLSENIGEFRGTIEGIYKYFISRERQ